MSGYLQRLARRAHGRAEDAATIQRDTLQPRVPLLFEPFTDVETQPLTTMANAAASPLTDSLSPTAPDVKSDTAQPQQPVQFAAAPTIASHAPTSPSSTSPTTTQQAMPPRRRSQRAEPVIALEPSQRSESHSEQSKESGDRVAPGSAFAYAPAAAPRMTVHAHRDDEPPTTPSGSGSAPREAQHEARRRAPPQPSFSLSRALPRVTNATTPHTGQDAALSSTDDAAAANSPVVQITIERLDVKAVAPNESRGRKQRAPRRDTLSEYLARRQENSR